MAQLAYLAVRFRWTFGAAAVAAMTHDVVILLGLFAWLGKPLDGVFLAALLTVIGYSVNDSVVVFDRIRERLRGRPGSRWPAWSTTPPADHPAHGQHRAGRAVHPGRPVRPRRRHPDRLRARAAGRHPRRHLLLGVRGRAATGHLRAALTPQAAAATCPAQRRNGDDREEIVMSPSDEHGPGSPDGHRRPGGADGPRRHRGGHRHRNPGAAPRRRRRRGRRRGPYERQPGGARRSRSTR